MTRVGGVEESRKLCVIPFRTVNNSYIFDARTGSVFASDDIINECLELYQSLEMDEIRRKLIDKYEDGEKVNSAMAFVQKMVNVKKAFYKSDEQAKEERLHIEDFNENDIKTLLYDVCMTEQMILNVTEDCNLRCKYCFFSEPYEYSRNRTTKMMTEEVALRSLDFYFEKMAEIKKRHPGKIAAITFYGGEPLMNFDLIKKCVEYTKEKCPSVYMFNITTNGMLLKGEKADFLYENGFSISVSIDGNKENHDRNRVTENGSGSFDIVYNNIKEFQKKYPDYERISLVCVYDYATKIMENDKFFEEEGLPKITFINQVASKDTNFYDRFDEQMQRQFIAEYQEALNRYLSSKRDGNKSPNYINTLFDNGAIPALMRMGSDEIRIPFMQYTGMCVPGMKISVSADGDFFICEKMDCSKPIGSYKTGLDYGAIVNIIKQYNRSVTTDCAYCPLYRSCSACFMTTATRDGFQKPECARMIEYVRTQLTIVYSVLEQNPGAYDYFTNKVEWILNR